MLTSRFRQVIREGNHKGVSNIGAPVSGGVAVLVAHHGGVGRVRREGPLLVAEGHVHVQRAVAPRLPRQLVFLDLQQHPRRQQTVERSWCDHGKHNYFGESETVRH